MKSVHPRPRRTERGAAASRKAMEDGVEPEAIIKGVKRYAVVSALYDRDKVKYADNWLVAGDWMQIQIPERTAEQAAASAEERARQSKVNAIKSGKEFLCRSISPSTARDLEKRGLVTEAECKAVGLW